MPMTPLPPDRGWCGDPKRGAAMGRASINPNDDKPRKFYLRRERIDSQGYDSGGSYWGIGSPLYRYESEDGEASGYLRAKNRESAKAGVRITHADAIFFN